MKTNFLDNESSRKKVHFPLDKKRMWEIVFEKFARFKNTLSNVHIFISCAVALRLMIRKIVHETVIKIMYTLEEYKKCKTLKKREIFI